MQTLPQALYEDHQERVHLETPVEAIRDAGTQFRLETPRRSFTVDSLVLTTPAHVTATLLESIAPESASALNKLTYNSLVTVHLESEDAFDATGFQVQYEEDFRTLGATCNESLFGRDSVYTCFLGGSKTPELIDWTTTAIQQTAVRKFREITGADARPLHVRRLPEVMPAYDTSWIALDDVETPSGIHLCANYESRAGIPGRISEAHRLAERLVESENVASAGSTCP